MNKGMLYWITGLSGAGKTTVGSRLYYRMRAQKKNTAIFSGGILKDIVGKDLGYRREDRLERAYRYSALCKLLTDQGIHVIICTIAMFDEIREWNREHIENYVEVFLDVEMEVLKRRSRNELYSEHDGKTAGSDLAVEYPKDPDLVIKNDGRQSLDDIVQNILNYTVVPQKRWNRDEAYWNNYYACQAVTEAAPSLFACAMLQKYIEIGGNLVELGCGNGRDSLYFAKHGVHVTGIDASEVAINELQKKNLLQNCIFICDDFVSAESLYRIQYDYCYSRFTLHAINVHQETQILQKAYDMLKENGYLFIEARSVNDKKYGAGQAVERYAYICDGHYRRFIVLQELLAKLQDIGFTIIESAESDQFAPLKDDIAVCVRVVAQKTNKDLQP